jgi:hypothetical protein
MLEIGVKKELLILSSHPPKYSPTPNPLLFGANKIRMA